MSATEGMGARLLALQDPDGQWAGGAYFPADFDWHGPEAAEGAGQPWTATTWSLNALRDFGLDAAALAGTAEKLRANSRWEYDELPYWGGEVDACINAFTLANGVWLGADVAGARAVIDPGAVFAICQDQHRPVTKSVTQLVELLPRISHVLKILPTNYQQVHRGQA